jgi:hypothetical protein
MKNKLKIISVLPTLILVFAVSGYAQKAEPLEIKFAKGKSAAIVSRTLSNEQETDYVFAARAGQKISLKVSSKPSGRLFDFTIMGDGFELQTQYDSYYDYDFTAPETGNYLVTVRKRPTESNQTAKFFLTLSIK